MKNKIVIFDLDGTLALIDKRRAISQNPDTGKMDWDKFFDPALIDLDEPNHAVIQIAKMFKDAGNMIVIFSGRSKATKDATKTWLNKHGVPFDVLKMRPTSSGFKFMPDDKLKQTWLDDLITDKNDVLCVFDDRQKVVDMWRNNGLTCMQVAPGNF